MGHYIDSDARKSALSKALWSVRQTPIFVNARDAVFKVTA
jgi:hypothetical protein